MTPCRVSRSNRPSQTPMPAQVRRERTSHMTEHLFKQAFIAIYVFILLAVALYGIHRYMLVYLYIKHRKNTYLPKGKFQQLPRITVLASDDGHADPQVMRAREEMGDLIVRLRHEYSLDEAGVM